MLAPASWEAFPRSKAVPYLAAALKDMNAGVRELAAECLCAVGPDASAAVPALLEALKDPGKHVRASAADCTALDPGNWYRATSAQGPPLSRASMS